MKICVKKRPAKMSANSQSKLSPATHSSKCRDQNHHGLFRRCKSQRNDVVQVQHPAGSIFSITHVPGGLCMHSPHLTFFLSPSPSTPHPLSLFISISLYISPAIHLSLLTLPLSNHLSISMFQSRLLFFCKDLNLRWWHIVDNRIYLPLLLFEQVRV